MAVAVTLADRLIGGLPALPRLALLIGTGGAVYLGWLATFARARLAEMMAMLRRSGTA